jgi:hypothetical protein
VSTMDSLQPKNPWEGRPWVSRFQRDRLIYYLDLSLDAYNESRVQLLDDRRVFEIAKRFELGR